MTISPTLAKYLAKMFLVNLLFMAVVLLAIVYLFDTVELLRRASRNEGVSFGLVLKMGLFKMPEMAEVISPFIVLFSAMYTFWSLSRRHELMALRAAGVSVWEFLAPILAVGVASGLLMIAIINPIGAIFVGKFNALQDLYLERKNLVAVFEEGLWLRQGTDDNGYAILHAEKLDMPDWRLQKVMAMFFTQDDQLSRRIDSQNAKLTEGAWVFTDTVLTEPRGGISKAQKIFTLPTKLTARDIEESFSSPESMGFWSLPSFIKTLDVTGFDSTRLRIHFQKLLSMPFLYAAMILLAAAVGLRPTRQGGTFMMIVFGVVFGFLIFFMASFLQALGASHQLPVFLAAWSPSLFTLLLGTAALMTLEDG